MKGLLLRVGIDTGSGGSLAPIFGDGLFEYIPIPEIQATSETRIYAKMKGVMTGKPMVDFVPEKIRYSHPHYDPEFDTFTYGDPTRTKRNQLSKLSPGDLLIFYAGLKPIDWKDKSRLYVIGYFEVEEVYDFENIRRSDYHSVFRKVPNNAHSKIYFRLKKLNVEYSDKKLVIVKGNSKSSELLRKARLLGDHNNRIRKELASIFGYEGSLVRAVGHWIKEKHIHMVKEWLEHVAM